MAGIPENDIEGFDDMLDQYIPRTMSESGEFETNLTFDEDVWPAQSGSAATVDSHPGPAETNPLLAVDAWIAQSVPAATNPHLSESLPRLLTPPGSAYAPIYGATLDNGQIVGGGAGAAAVQHQEAPSGPSVSNSKRPAQHFEAQTTSLPQRDGAAAAPHLHQKRSASDDLSSRPANRFKVVDPDDEDGPDDPDQLLDYLLSIVRKGPRGISELSAGEIRQFIRSVNSITTTGASVTVPKFKWILPGGGLPVTGIACKLMKAGLAKVEKPPVFPPAKSSLITKQDNSCFSILRYLKTLDVHLMAAGNTEYPWNKEYIKNQVTVLTQTKSNNAFNALTEPADQEEWVKTNFIRTVRRNASIQMRAIQTIAWSAIVDFCGRLVSDGKSHRGVDLEAAIRGDARIAAMVEARVAEMQAAAAVAAAPGEKFSLADIDALLPNISSKLVYV